MTNTFLTKHTLQFIENVYVLYSALKWSDLFETLRRKMFDQTKNFQKFLKN